MGVEFFFEFSHVGFKDKLWHGEVFLCDFDWVRCWSFRFLTKLFSDVVFVCLNLGYMGRRMGLILLA